MQLNVKQLLGISIGVLGVLMISTANLTDLFGPTVARLIVSTAAMLNAILGAVVTAVSGQSSTVKEVLAMPGVAHIDVNAQANQTLAALAVDPTVNKIAPAPHAAEEVQAIAKGAS